MKIEKKKSKKMIKIGSFEDFKKQMVIYKKLGENEKNSFPHRKQQAVTTQKRI